MPFTIRSSAIYLPESAISAEALDERLGLARGTCRSRYGVNQRHVAAAHESALMMGASAIRRALDAAGMSLADIDLLISASGVSHQALPYNAAGILHALESDAALACMDVNASCLSFLAALEMSECALASGRYGRVLIVSSEVATVGISAQATEAATLFADGAAAYVLEVSTGDQGLITSRFQTYREGYALCQIRGGGTGLHPARASMAEVAAGSYFEMRGKPLLKLVSRLAPAFVTTGLEAVGLSSGDMDWVVPHQASHAAIAHVSRRLGLDPERVVDVYADMGNQIAASLPIALHHLLQTQRPPSGQRVMLFGSAAGLTLGLGVLRL